DVAARRITGAQLIGDHGGVAADRREDVAEVVNDGADLDRERPPFRGIRAAFSRRPSPLILRQGRGLSSRTASPGRTRRLSSARALCQFLRRGGASTVWRALRSVLGDLRLQRGGLLAQAGGRLGVDVLDQAGERRL